VTKPRTNWLVIARERLTLIQQQEQEITELRRALAKAKAGSLDLEADAELDAFYSIRADMPETWTPADIAEEVERMAGRLKLLEDLFAAVEDAYGPTDAANCKSTAAELKRFAALPDDARDLAEALVDELGPEPAERLARRLNTIPAFFGTRTPRDVARVLGMYL
jgi:hypothetical protein